jgi:hypothetical protein
MKRQIKRLMCKRIIGNNHISNLWHNHQHDLRKLLATRIKYDLIGAK